MHHLHASTRDLRCHKCGYLLRGLDRSMDCPECGEPVHASALRVRVHRRFVILKKPQLETATWLLCVSAGLIFASLPFICIQTPKPVHPIETMRQSMLFLATITSLAAVWKSGDATFRRPFAKWRSARYLGRSILVLALCLWLLVR